MNRESRVENADSTRPLSSAVKSMARWFHKELTEITNGIAYGRRRLETHPDDEETRQSVRELQRQRDELCDGWEHSSLRRAAGSSSDDPAEDGREQRAGLAIADGPPEVQSARATSTSGTTTAKSIAGYAAVFGRETVIAGVFREVIQAGAFTEALANSDIRCLFNHDPNYLLGRTSASTLELKQDSKGLFFRAYLLPYDSISYGIARRVDRRDLQGCSFSFWDVQEKWVLARKPGDLDLRILEKIGRLYDLGPVTFPAYESTTITATFETAPRSAAPADDDETEPNVDLVVKQPRGSRPIPAWQQRILELEHKAIEQELHDWDIDHVGQLLDDLDRRIKIDAQRKAHLALHPGDAGRIDIPGGLLYAGRG